MAEYYSNLSDIQELLGGILNIGTGLTNISVERVEIHQKLVDEIINSRLESVYAVPLKKIKRNGVTKYPDPIPSIANRLVVASLIDTYYTGETPNISQAGKRLKEEATFDLTSLCNGIAVGTIRLEGQRLKAKVRFARPTIQIQPAPGSPVETPTGGIGVK